MIYCMTYLHSFFFNSPLPTAVLSSVAAANMKYRARDWKLGMGSPSAASKLLYHSVGNDEMI